MSVRIAGDQALASLRAMGGIWTIGMIATACKLTPDGAKAWPRTDEYFPMPLTKVPAFSHTGTMSLYCGEDVLAFLELTGRWAYAQNFAEAITELRSVR